MRESYIRLGLADWEDDMQLLMLLFVGLAAGRTTKGGRKESCISLFRFLHKQAADDGVVEHMAMARFTFPHLRLLDLHQKASALVNY